MTVSSTFSDDGRELNININGRFDFSDHKSFRNTYGDINSPGVTVTLDMSGTDYIDSAALGMLLLLRERVGGDSARIKITGCREDVLKVLEVSRFHQLFDIVPGEQSISNNR